MVACRSALRGRRRCWKAVVWCAARRMTAASEQLPRAPCSTCHLHGAQPGALGACSSSAGLPCQLTHVTYARPLPLKKPRHGWICTFKGLQTFLGAIPVSDWSACAHGQEKGSLGIWVYIYI